MTSWSQWKRRWRKKRKRIVWAGPNLYLQLFDLLDKTGRIIEVKALQELSNIGDIGRFQVEIGRGRDLSRGRIPIGNGSQERLHLSREVWDLKWLDDIVLEVDGWRLVEHVAAFSEIIQVEVQLLADVDVTLRQVGLEEILWQRFDCAGVQLYGRRLGKVTAEGSFGEGHLTIAMSHVSRMSLGSTPVKVSSVDCGIIPQEWPNSEGKKDHESRYNYKSHPSGENTGWRRLNVTDN